MIVMSNGISICSSELVPEFNYVPKKKHKLMRSTGISYHNRVQKKWNKKFGFVKEIHLVRAGDRIYCHPNTLTLMRKHAVNTPYETINI